MKYLPLKQLRLTHPFKRAKKYRPSRQIQAFKDLNLNDKARIAAFIEKNSIMTKDYVVDEFFKHKDRDLLSVFNEKKELVLVMSIKFIKNEKKSYVYWGDLVKKEHHKGINLSSLFLYYLLKKEGLFNLLVKEKLFLSFCYNPRIYNLSAPFLKKYSAFDGNIPHPIASECLNTLGFNENHQRGHYYDAAIKKRISLSLTKRYTSNNQKLNQYFCDNIFESDKKNYYYSGKSLIIVSEYKRKYIAWALLLLAATSWDNLIKKPKKGSNA